MTDVPTETGKTLVEIAKDIITTEDTPEDTRNSGELLVELGLKVIHFRPNTQYGRTLHGLTVVYKELHRNSNVIEVATAIVHPKDTFTKRTGVRLAVKAFVAGRTVCLPVLYKKRPATHTLMHYFN